LVVRYASIDVAFKGTINLVIIIVYINEHKLLPMHMTPETQDLLVFVVDTMRAVHSTSAAICILLVVMSCTLVTSTWAASGTYIYVHTNKNEATLFTYFIYSISICIV
jgi:hypothetical protein